MHGPAISPVRKACACSARCQHSYAFQTRFQFRYAQHATMRQSRAVRTLRTSLAFIPVTRGRHCIFLRFHASETHRTTGPPRLAVEAASKSLLSREESPEVQRDEIARRAYDRFLGHGAQHGDQTGSAERNYRYDIASTTQTASRDPAVLRHVCIDHAATALLVKRRYPAVPLALLLISVQAMELTWVGLNYLGVERTTTEAEVRSASLTSISSRCRIPTRSGRRSAPRCSRG